MGFACPGRSFPLSPRFDSRSLHTPAKLLELATNGRRRNVGSGNPPATAAGPDMPGTPPQSRNPLPTPSDFGGIPLPSLHTTYWGYLSQADTPLVGIRNAFSCAANLRRDVGYLLRLDRRF